MIPAFQIIVAVHCSAMVSLLSHLCVIEGGGEVVSGPVKKTTRGTKRRAIRRGLRAMASKLGGSRGKPEEALDALVCIFDADGNELQQVTLPTGSTLLAAARQARIDLDHYCGGQCSCGTCRVNVPAGAENLSRMSGMEEMVLGATHTQNGCRLACQACIKGPVSFQVPRWF